MEKKLYHCWHSVKQAELTGEILYHIEGKDVPVTIVAHDLNHDCNWDDLVYCGQGYFVSRLSYGRLGRLGWA